MAISMALWQTQRQRLGQRQSTDTTREALCATQTAQAATPASMSCPSVIPCLGLCNLIFILCKNCSNESYEGRVLYRKTGKYSIL